MFEGDADSDDETLRVLLTSLIGGGARADTLSPPEEVQLTRGVADIAGSLTS